MWRNATILFSRPAVSICRSRGIISSTIAASATTSPWLRGKLLEAGLEATEPDQEDWGWYMDVRHGTNRYFVGIGGNVESVSSGNRGEWRFVVEKYRGFGEKLTGANPMSADEPIIGILKGIVETEPDMKFLHVE